jgi:hypothetical protein
MKTCKFLLILMAMLMFLPVNAVAKEFSYEDEDAPISFKTKILSWDKVNEIVPKGKKFTVIDVDTGKSFHVQRRAGSKHADVQPLTKKDTKTMKEIYEGKWSWRRRAIIVVVGDQMIAASMHGMPHGAGALENGFPGHFCIHFWGSTTHKKGNMDLAHKVMILKAVGKLDQYLNEIGPYELIEVFLTAINNDDGELLEKTAGEPKPQLRKVAKELTYFSITKMSLLPVDDVHGVVQIEVPAKVEFYRKNNGKSKRNIHFVLQRDLLTNRWYVNEGSFLDGINWNERKKNEN